MQRLALDTGSTRLALDELEALREHAPAQAVRLEFWYTADDYADALRTYARRRLGPSRRVLTVVALLVALLLLGAGQAGGWWLLLWLALLWLGLPRWLRRQAAAQFARETRFHDRALMQFDLDGLLLRNSAGYMVADWSYYHEAWESDTVFLLFFQTQLFHIVPKRVFSSAAQRERFRELLERRVPVVRS